MIGVTFLRVDGGQFLKLRYTFNPEAIGVKSTASEWHRDRYHYDPKKVAFVDKLKNWGQEMLPLVRQGTKQSLAANVVMPQIPVQ